MKKLIGFFVIGLLLGWSVLAYPQSNIVTMKYKYPGGSRVATFDTVYGNQTRGANTYRLALKDVNGGYLIGWAAYGQLILPIWGEGKTFGDLLPTLTADQGIPTINVSNWKAYDPANDFKPTEPGLYTCRKRNGLGWMTFAPMALESEIYWQAIGITEYKKDSDPSYYSKPNPDYVNNQALRDSEKALYKQLLYDNFTLLGDAIFPVLYDNLYPRQQTCTWWLLVEGRYQEVPVVNGKYNVSRKLVPWLAGEDINFAQWQGYVSRTMLVTPIDRKLKMLVGIN